MAGSTYGRLFTITTWGESHGKGIGVVVDGCPAGLPLNEEDIQIYLDRRKPGQSKFTTQRNEADAVQILSTVQMTNIDNNRKMTYTIVSESEANIKAGKISIKTPIAQGLLNHKVGEVVEVKIPRGIIHLRIDKISID